MTGTQKFSKEHSSRHVPDKVVEAVEDTEKAGRSAGAGSDNTCTRKRKADQINIFNVPVSKVPGSEKEEVKKKLEAVKKSVSMTPVTSTAVLASCNKWSSTKPPLPPKAPGGSTAALSSSINRHVKKHAPLPSGNSVAMRMRHCKTILKNLMKHRHAWVFNSPVDPVKLQIPDYSKIIKHPMDLGTINKKIESDSYCNPQAFAADVRLTFTNAMTFNPPDDDVHNMAKTLLALFEKKWENIEVKLTAAEEILEKEKDATMLNSVGPKITYEKREEMKNRLESFSGNLPDSILDFLVKQSHVESDKKEIEFDLGTSSDDTLLKLEKLLDDHVKQSVPQRTVQPHQMENLVVPGVSNSSKHLRGANDPDIGVEIYKDTTRRNIQRGTSRSSRRDSASGSFSGSHQGVPPIKGKKMDPKKLWLKRKELERQEEEDGIDSGDQ